MIPPKDVVSPKTRIRDVEPISDGTTNGNCFSLAKLTLHDGNLVAGIRWDYSDWSEDPDKGYPLIRGQYPCWFVLPDINLLKSVLNEIDTNKFY